MSTYCLVVSSRLDTGSCVTVTVVNPPNVSDEPPNEMAVVPMVTELLVSDALPILVNVFAEPLIDLFVSVSVVARPTNVSVDVGKVNVPVFTMLEITGVVNVLLDSVCDPVSVTTELSIEIVTGAEPL